VAIYELHFNVLKYAALIKNLKWVTKFNDIFHVQIFLPFFFVQVKLVNRLLHCLAAAYQK
jgi:hypothetical protein